MSLLSELKRRNVFRIAGIYAVVSWILMQVAGTLEASLKLPEWFDSVITAALLIGFPIALLLAWAFEMTPEGVKPTETTVDGDNSTSAGKMDALIIVGVVLILAFGIWQQMSKPDMTPEKEAAEKTPKELEIVDASIAVLPFSDLSQAGDQEYFSDGISEEILNVLVQVEALKVASRTSSFGFKGQEALGIPLIAKKLNVRHVLEGSVRKSGDMLRITAQLIDAKTDQHLWSQTYDRTLTTENIFSIQDEISKAIVEQLGIVLDRNGQVLTPKIDISTENLDAYELYLEGSALLKNRNADNLPIAISKFEKAVELDRKFANAWAKLAASYGVAPSWGGNDREYSRLSNEAATTAIQLNPALALPYAIRGANFASAKPARFSEAFADYERALDRDPHNAEIYMWRGENYVNLGFFEKAEKDFLRCLELEPEKTICMPWLGKTYIYQGRHKAAFEVYDKAITAGSYAMLQELIAQYATQDNKQAVRYLLALERHGWNAKILDTDRIYRLLTDDSFDFDSEFDEFETIFRARIGEDATVGSYIQYLFKRYQHMKVDYYRTPWWSQYDQEFLRSSYRKKLIRDAGIYQYWLEAEFPPQCRAISDDDFECD